MKRLLIPILFVLFLTFGCVGHKEEVAKAVTNNSLGILYYTYTINSKDTTTMNLMRNQEKSIEIHIKNDGKYSLENLSLKLISCIEPKFSHNKISSLMPGSIAFFEYVLFNNLSLPGQEIRCDSTVRAYFFYKTKSYVDIALINESYRGNNPTLNQYSDNELLTVSYDLPRDFLMLGNDITGKIIVRNVGLGFVDYSNISQCKMNEIYSLKLEIPRDLELISMGGEKLNGDWYSNNSEMIGNKEYEVYTFNASNLGNKSYILTLGTGAGNTGLLYIPITLKPTVSTSNYTIERMYVTLYYGYSYDLFKFYLNLYSSGSVSP